MGHPREAKPTERRVTGWDIIDPNCTYIIRKEKWTSSFFSKFLSPNLSGKSHRHSAPSRKTRQRQCLGVDQAQLWSSERPMHPLDRNLQQKCWSIHTENGTNHNDSRKKAKCYNELLFSSKQQWPFKNKKTRGFF